MRFVHSSSPIKLLFRTEHSGFHEFADDVTNHNVAFLNAGSVFGRHIEQYVRIVLHCAAGFSGHCDDVDVHFAGHFKGLDDVFGIAGRGDAHDDVPFSGGALKETGEDEVIAVVVADGGEVGGVAVQSLGVKRRTVEVESAGEFRCEVLRVCRAAAVSAEVDFTTGAQRIRNHSCCCFNAGEKFRIVQDCLLGVDTVLYGLLDSGGHLSI